MPVAGDLFQSGSSEVESDRFRLWFFTQWNNICAADRNLWRGWRCVCVCVFSFTWMGLETWGGSALRCCVDASCGVEPCSYTRISISRVNIKSGECSSVRTEQGSDLNHLTPPPMPPAVREQHVSKSTKKQHPGVNVIVSRSAGVGHRSGGQTC